MKARIVKQDFTGLNNLVKALDDNRIVKVGIFGDKTRREEGTLTNAEMGAIHEFGSFSAGIPKRSFLRAPLHAKGEDIVKKLTGIVETMVETGDKRDPLALLGIEAEAVIETAFDTQGSGLKPPWQKLAPSTAKRKGSDTILSDTGQLKRAIASKVDNRE